MVSSSPSRGATLTNAASPPSRPRRAAAQSAATRLKTEEEELEELQEKVTEEEVLPELDAVIQAAAAAGQGRLSAKKQGTATGVKRKEPKVGRRRSRRGDDSDESEFAVESEEDEDDDTEEEDSVEMTPPSSDDDEDDYDDDASDYDSDRDKRRKKHQLQQQLQQQQQQRYAALNPNWRPNLVPMGGRVPISSYALQPLNPQMFQQSMQYRLPQMSPKSPHSMAAGAPVLSPRLLPSAANQAGVSPHLRAVPGSSLTPKTGAASVPAGAMPPPASEPPAPRVMVFFNPYNPQHVATMINMFRPQNRPPAVTATNPMVGSMGAPGSSIMQRPARPPGMNGAAPQFSLYMQQQQLQMQRMNAAAGAPTAGGSTRWVAPPLMRTTWQATNSMSRGQRASAQKSRSKRRRSDDEDEDDDDEDDDMTDDERVITSADYSEGVRPRRNVKRPTKYVAGHASDEEEDRQDEQEDEQEEGMDGVEEETEAPASETKTPSKKPTKQAASTQQQQQQFLEDDGGDDDSAKKIIPALSLPDALPPVDDVGLGIEKILSSRLDDDGEMAYLVKYKNQSYLHVEWIAQSLLLSDRYCAPRVKRFDSKPLSEHHYTDDEPFNPLFTRIDRVLAEYVVTHEEAHKESANEEEEGPLEPDHYYLVKWCAQPYELASWELKADLLELDQGQEKINDYVRRLQPNCSKFIKQAPNARPPVTAFEKLEESPVYKNGNLLRQYQLEGLNWLLFCWFNRQGSIIADEMGLGKTVQSVSFLHQLYTKYNVPGPFLIIAPLSTIPHWQREFEGWTDLNSIVYHGSQASRDVLQQYEFYYKTMDGQPLTSVSKFDVLITTYEMISFGQQHLASIPWKVAILDEAHRLKNKSSRVAEVLKTYRMEHRVLCTGTPLQNRLEELFALLHFLEPQRFHDERVFLRDYGNMQKSEDVHKLQALLKPIMLRRLKEDVEKSIPVKEETIIEVELTAPQKKYYRAILERNLAFLTKGLKSSNMPKLINTVMELRKCCIHPYLIPGAEDRITKEANVHTDEDALNLMIQASGKLVLLDKLLARLKQNGHKVLVFSQMTRCLDLLADYLTMRQYKYERIDGAVRGDLRQAAIDRFSTPTSDVFVFLLCTRAGGVGINLTAADTVVIYDSDWNPQNDLQAQARCHRIGQTKSVKIYRLLTRHTYEREMFDRAGMKLGLDRAILQGSNSGNSQQQQEEQQHDIKVDASGRPQLSKKEIEMLLKKGAYGLVMENDEDAIQFCEESIDQILERRTTVIQHDSNTSRAVGAAENSLFSKASFAVTQSGESVDLDDPDFWSKWAKSANVRETLEEEEEEVALSSTRRRRVKQQQQQPKAGSDSDASYASGGLEEERSSESDAEAAVEDGSSSDGSHTPPPRLGRGSRAWSFAERLRLEKMVLTFGLDSADKWIDLFPFRSVKDCEAASRLLYQFCGEALKGGKVAKSNKGKKAKDVAVSVQRMNENDAQLLKGLSAVLGAMEQDKEMPYPGANAKQVQEFKTFLSTAPVLKHFTLRARPLLQRVLLLTQLKQIMDYPRVDSLDFELPLIGNVALPCSGWQPVHDKSLVLGVCRHGYLNSVAMRQDETLAFKEMFPIKEEERTVARESKKRRGRPPKNSLRLDDDLNENENVSRSTRSKSKVMEEDVEESDLEEELERVHEDGADEMDESNENTVINENDNNNDENDNKDGVSFPSKSTLSARLKRILFVVERARKKGTSPRSSQSAVTTSTPSSNHPVALFRGASCWAKPDRLKFLRAMNQFGKPPLSETNQNNIHHDWSLFRAMSGLWRKPDNILEAYLEEFMQMLKDSMESKEELGQELDETKQELNEAKRELDETKQEEENEMKDHDLEHDQEHHEANHENSLENSQTSPPRKRRRRGAVDPLPVDRARRCLERLEQFQFIRQFFTLMMQQYDQDESAILSHLTAYHRTAGLPEWWQSPEHDWALIKGVCRYGLSGVVWMVADDSLPFKEIYTQQCENIMEEEEQPEQQQEEEQALHDHISNASDEGTGATANSSATRDLDEEAKRYFNVSLPSIEGVQPGRIQFPVGPHLQKRVESLYEHWIKGKEEELKEMISSSNANTSNANASNANASNASNNSTGKRRRK